MYQDNLSSGLVRLPPPRSQLTNATVSHPARSWILERNSPAFDEIRSSSGPAVTRRLLRHEADTLGGPPNVRSGMEADVSMRHPPLDEQHQRGRAGPISALA